MQSKDAGLNTRILVILLTVILFAPSCKKSEPASEPGGNKVAANPEKSGDNETGKTSEPSKTPTTAGLVPLPIKLPKPTTRVTPTPATVPNLETPLGRDRDPFLAPVGAKNVALGKPVSSSDDAPIVGENELITDGDRETSDGSYVELGPGLQHVTIDLGAKYEIYAVLFWHYHGSDCVYFDVVVQIADDSDFITNVTTIFNNDYDNSCGFGSGPDKNYVETNEGKLVDAKRAQGRYVRLYSDGNNLSEMNRYIEVEVYGKPVQ
jgi:hypothetical protein